MALNTNMWVVLLILGLKSDLVHGVGNTCAFPDVPRNSKLTTPVSLDHVYQEGDAVKYRCKDGFTISGNKKRRCTNGQWTKVRFTCDDSGVDNTCAFPDVPRNSKLTQRKARDHVYQEGDVVKYQCKDGFTISGSNVRRCTSGQWTKVRFTCDGFVGCTLSESFVSSKYTYTDDEGNKIVPPYSMMDGSKITVECKYASFIYDYYDVTPNDNITCVNGILDSVSMDCPDSPDQAVNSDLCQKFEVKNGSVSRNAVGMYYVLCDQGYTLNIPKIAHDRPCNCSEGELVCFAGTKPVCKADNCEIPFDIDRRLSVYQMRPRVYLTEGDKISDQTYVFFNCSDVIEQKYEPANRRFQCVRGKWMEADRSPVWKLNYNGAFPECREAKCDPPCKNGGVCFRDGECKCEHMTTGAICETFLCDKSCAKNGGQCVRPGRCGNCPISRRGDNCEIDDTCEIPSDIDRRLSVYQWRPRVSFTEGDKISNKSYVFFNCSNVIEQKYEPANRRFQCVRGKWMEADKSPVWKLNYSGTFPECREAKCDPPCKNGGVCFRDGECKCEHMTTGAICETFMCDKVCAKNGGQCVSPGRCGKCPIYRRGDNCEIKETCELPSNAATHENHRIVFEAGESISHVRMKCNKGYTLSSMDVMRCQDNGTWSTIIMCQRETNFKYVVRLQVADYYLAGTSNDIYVNIYGHGKQTATTRMTGNFGQNELVENEIRGIDVRPIQKVVVSKRRSSFWNYDDNLWISYVSIFIDDSDDYYVFTNRDQDAVLLTASEAVELSISRHPERCIHTYGKAMYRSPKPGKRGATEGFMSLRECKQRCATTRSLSCNSIYFMPYATHRRGFGHCFHYIHSPDDSNYFMDDTRQPRRRPYVSYKRMCR